MQLGQVFYRDLFVFGIQLSPAHPAVDELEMAEQLPLVVLERSSREQEAEVDSQRLERPVEEILVVLETLAFVDDKTGPVDRLEETASLVVLSRVVGHHDDMSHHVAGA